jgi:hypothetical protein
MGARVSVPPPPPPPLHTGVQDYAAANREYATYSNMGVTQAIRETGQALKPLRAKTAPADDLERERRAISREAQESLLLVQLALFLVFLSLLSYVVLPRDWANGVSVLLLSVGIGSGFFLRR